MILSFSFKNWNSWQQGLCSPTLAMSSSWAVDAPATASPPSKRSRHSRGGTSTASRTVRGGGWLHLTEREGLRKTITGSGCYLPGSLSVWEPGCIYGCPKRISWLFYPRMWSWILRVPHQERRDIIGDVWSFTPCKSEIFHSKTRKRYFRGRIERTAFWNPLHVQSPQRCLHFRRRPFVNTKERMSNGGMPTSSNL